MSESISNILEPGTKDWDLAWGSLAKDPLNNGCAECVNVTNGEVWQYMGPDKEQHCFRHRCHPKTNNTEYCRVPFSKE